MSSLKFILAQLNFTVGDIENNAEKILSTVKAAKVRYQADIIVFPELALSGYPPEDLLFRKDFLIKIKNCLENIKENLPSHISAIIGYPEYEAKQDKVYNSAAVLSAGKILLNYRKRVLPNYGVFDEKRYFTPGETDAAGVFMYKNYPIGLAICEDLWFRGVAEHLQQNGAKIVVSINASPFHAGKINTRIEKMRQRVKETHLPLLYAHHCGAQDDLVFDGSSFALNQEGELVAKGPFAKEYLLEVILDKNSTLRAYDIYDSAHDAQLYEALKLGVSDYVKKNHFKKILLGFSGGVDSALTLAISVDALGKENVLPVMIPSCYTSPLSLNAAYQQLKMMDLQHFREIPIDDIYALFLSRLNFDKDNTNLSAQNLQARIRAVILMALSNETGALLLNTSNKSEIAVGYGTLYGDMCGAYGVIKDVWKTEVYRLVHYRNQVSPVIPEDIIRRPPSAELAPDQLDTDTLPPYEILDDILKKYIEEEKSLADIIQSGINADTAKRVIQMVVRNEYKRKQTPLGPRVSPLAFTRERRYPITSSFDAR